VLVERERSPLKGYWSLPGRAETGNICRKAFAAGTEETGLVVEPLRVTIFERHARWKGKPGITTC
jgi:ADP-ribose pyrophosphatase YjhB (NUDIX family)